jgi:hypothetical protein
MSVAQRPRPQSSAGPATPIELSIVMPCLNEIETLAKCIRKAHQAIEALGVAAEIVVADNGSTDGSQAVARELGVQVVDVTRRGYGSALIGGVAAARGRFVIMGDADDSYDFTAIGPLLEKLRQGADLVMGNRFAGGIRQGAMVWSHRWVGNPALTSISKVFFHTPVGDMHCGLRGFRKDAYERLRLRATGMEFASEMVIKASLQRMRITEVPVTLSPDGRSRPPHLRTWRDGWRHLRFMLLFSPRWLFLYPGIALFALGLSTGAALEGGPRQIHVSLCPARDGPRRGRVDDRHRVGRTDARRSLVASRRLRIARSATHDARGHPSRGAADTGRADRLRELLLEHSRHRGSRPSGVERHERRPGGAGQPCDIRDGPPAFASRPRIRRRLRRSRTSRLHGRHHRIPQL